MTDLVVQRADLCTGRPPVDLRASGGRIVAVGRVRPRPVDQVLDAKGCAVLPGLHDHHVHLLAQGAAQQSVQVGPPAVFDAAGFAAALVRADRDLPPGSWIRAVGYHESVAGLLDRTVLDALVPGRRVRVQHRSGIQWTLSTAGLVAVGLAGPDAKGPPPPGGAPPPGVERDHDGRPTGRLRRADRWLAGAVGADPPDLAAVGALAAAQGITGFTDATPFACTADLNVLREAVVGGVVPQRVLAMTAPGVGADLPGADLQGADLDARPLPVGDLAIGPVKVLLDDNDLPDLVALAQTIAAAHHRARPVAVHCVTRVQAVLTMAALEMAGTRRGDRIEHASVLPAELVAAVARLGVTVVTNPGFVRERGDRYLREVDLGDQEDLYRCRTLVDAGAPVAAGTDAPFGPADPWAVVAAAVARRTRSGALLGPGEALSPGAALGLFLGAPGAPGRRRRVVPGAPADLCVLGVPASELWRLLQAGPDAGGPVPQGADLVASCVVGGEVVADQR